MENELILNFYGEEKEKMKKSLFENKIIYNFFKDEYDEFEYRRFYIPGIKELSFFENVCMYEFEKFTDCNINFKYILMLKDKKNNIFSFEFCPDYDEEMTLLLHKEKKNNKEEIIMKTVKLSSDRKFITLGEKKYFELISLIEMFFYYLLNDKMNKRKLKSLFLDTPLEERFAEMKKILKKQIL